MGSKRAMLRNGLGELLSREVAVAHRFVDLFTGSGAVAIHVARHFQIPVLASDLQQYSVLLTGAVISRHTAFGWEDLWETWHHDALNCLEQYKIPSATRLSQSLVKDMRSWCNDKTDLPITRAYGGHYFSPMQSVWIDALRTSVPSQEPAKVVAIAALIHAASQCAAAPGHTAQPFQPTRTAKSYLLEAWNRDIVSHTKIAFTTLANQFARKPGAARVADANKLAEELDQDDLVFIDPPYTGVHYSRFYHVLESIARGTCGMCQWV